MDIYSFLGRENVDIFSFNWFRNNKNGVVSSLGNIDEYKNNPLTFKQCQYINIEIFLVAKLTTNYYKIDINTEAM